MANLVKTAYIPVDRAQALATGEGIPEQTSGTVMLIDISGFTQMTESLHRLLGDRQGAEKLTVQLNLYYDALITQVHRYGSSIIGFSGDGITCWFDSACFSTMTDNTVQVKGKTELISVAELARRYCTRSTRTYLVFNLITSSDKHNRLSYKLLASSVNGLH